MSMAKPYSDEELTYLLDEHGTMRKYGTLFTDKESSTFRRLLRERDDARRVAKELAHALADEIDVNNAAVMPSELAAMTKAMGYPGTS